MIEFIEGPLWTFSLVFFCLGVIWRILAIVRLGNRADLAPQRESRVRSGLRGIFARSIPRRETVHRSKLVIIAGYLFHLGLFVVLFWAAPHIKFLDERILGFAWTPVPYWVFQLAAALSFTGLMMLIVRRMVDPVLRKISTVDDYIGGVLVFIVMLTGCLAILESWDSLRALHMFWVELLMLYFPFSRLMHTFTFAFSRAYTGAMYGSKGVKA